MANYLLKVYCTMKHLSLRSVCGVKRVLFNVERRRLKGESISKWKTKSH